MNCAIAVVVCFLLHLVGGTEILQNGGLEGPGWQVDPSWAWCSQWACHVPAELKGPRSGTHFVMAYPGYRVVLAQSFNSSIPQIDTMDECNLVFYFKSTSEIDTFFNIYWGSDVYDLSTYSASDTYDGWKMYDILLYGEPKYLELEIKSENIAYVLADDFSLQCTPSRWSWAWTVETAAAIVVSVIILAACTKFVYKEQLCCKLADRWDVKFHVPSFRRIPTFSSVQMTEFNKSAFIQEESSASSAEQDIKEQG